MMIIAGKKGKLMKQQQVRFLWTVFCAVLCCFYTVFMLCFAAFSLFCLFHTVFVLTMDDITMKTGGGEAP